MSFKYNTVGLQWTDADIVSLLLDDGDLSSDSSSDSSDGSFFEDTPPLASKLPRKPGPQVIPSRFRATAQHLSDEDFFEEFRVNRHLVDTITDRFRKSSFYTYNGAGRYKGLSAYDHVLVFLWFAGHKATLNSTCEQFGLTKASVSRVIRHIAGFLVSISGYVIKWLEEDEIKASTEYFRLKGIPFTIGAIAVDHITIDNPGDEGRYFNKERDCFTLPLQLVCDHRKSIRHVFVGAWGSDDVSTVFESSSLKAELEHLCAHYVILGDHAFPCLRNLVTPYRGTLTQMKKNFNRLLSQGRSAVQGCFEKLVTKFPQLAHCRLRGKGDISQFITACCVLHNLSLDDSYLQYVGNSSVHSCLYSDMAAMESPGDVNDTPDGLEYRDDLLTAISIRRNWQ